MTPPKELKEDKLLYWMKSNSTYMENLQTLDTPYDQPCEEMLEKIKIM